MRTRSWTLALLALGGCLLFAAFGTSSALAWEVKTFTGGSFNQDGSSATQAGSHPYSATTFLEFPSKGFFLPEEEVRTVEVDLPPGFIGNPAATPTRCTPEQLLGTTEDTSVSGAGCPLSSQVGLADTLTAFGSINFLLPAQEGVPVFNMVPPPGVPAMLGYLPTIATPLPILVFPRVRTESDYGVTARVSGIPQIQPPPNGARLTLWGVPADSAHDEDRGYNSFTGFSCGSSLSDGEPECVRPLPEVPRKPFFTLPGDCSAGPVPVHMRATSWQHPDAVVAASFDTDTNGNPTAVDGCDQLDFSPTVEVNPTTDVADSPSGLEFQLHIPQNDDPDGFSAAHLKDAVVTLPEGLTVNPSSANGLGACSPAQIGLTTPLGQADAHFTADPASCPDNSKIGSVEVETPILDHPLKGFVFLASQNQNPFNSLLAIYITIDDRETGVVVKVPGEVRADHRTGQISAIVRENPQIPFEDLKVNFFGGDLASLRTPSSCGTFTADVKLTPWSAPEGASASLGDSFEVTQGAGGGACLSVDSQAPHQPSFTAGTVDPTAAVFTPFVLKLARADGTQAIKGIEMTLPQGLTGKLAGVPYCPEAALASAATKSGKSEQESPSCPSASQVGEVNVAAGAGPTPLSVGGKAYLAGPYKGAPLSMGIITPAVAGPFDLGTVVVRTALQVDPSSAQIKAVSDPIPTILQGIPLDVRTISVQLAKPQFTLNPTSCDPMAITGSALSAFDQAAALSNPFQVGDCARLAFKPNLRLKLQGGTKRDDHPALKSTLTFGKGNGANLKSATIILPPAEQIDNAHINNPCTRVQFNAGQCPRGSVLGYAKAFSPLLEQPLQGPVYFRSNGGERELPDVVADLNGQIHVIAVGFVDAIKGRLRTTFATVPDAPISKVTLKLKGGKKGLLVNNRNICARKYRFNLQLGAHNGKILESQPLLKNSCKGKAKKKKRGKAKKS